MSLIQCQVCGCIDNTNYCSRGFQLCIRLFDWSYAPEREGMILCTCCGPRRYSDGVVKTQYSGVPAGIWHGHFTRHFLPIGKYKTNREGNLSHVFTGVDNLVGKHIEPPEGICLLGNLTDVEKADPTKVFYKIRRALAIYGQDSKFHPSVLKSFKTKRNNTKISVNVRTKRTKSLWNAHPSQFLENTTNSAPAELVQLYGGQSLFRTPSSRSSSWKLETPNVSNFQLKPFVMKPSK